MLQNFTARVLVADDDLSSRMLMFTALEKQGLTVELACDGEEALNKFKSSVFDVVLLDVEMPRGDGFEVCDSIRRKLESKVPIVMVTGHGDFESIARSFQLGATDFIVKPINWTLIGYRMQYILRSYRTLQMLNAAEAQNSAMLRALPDILLRVGADGALNAVYGQYDHIKDLVNGSRLSHVFPPEVSFICLSAIRSAIRNDLVNDVDCVIPGPDGMSRYYEVRIARVSDNECLCLLRDVTGRREVEQRIEYLSRFDLLTGLPNRDSFQEQVQKEIARSLCAKGGFAILLLDLDGFNGINDTFGRQVGDEILRWVASQLKTSLRSSDFFSRLSEHYNELMPFEDGCLARMGGDEFSVLLLDISRPEDVLIVAQRIQQVLSKPRVIDGHELIMTVSIGASIFPGEGDDAHALLKFADTAMYAAKAQGRGHCNFYSATLTDLAFNRLSLESSLHKAVDRGEFVVFYQPQVDACDKSICSVEALVRWMHPEKGLVPPAEFITVAEEIDLIQPIGEFVLRSACRDVVKWDRLGLPPLRVAVNLSPIQLQTKGFVSLVQDVLTEFALPSGRLELEITESVLMKDADQSLSILRELRDTGVHISIDDFGTGYSSLRYLKALPITNLKVDRSFVKGLPNESSDAAIIKAIVSISKSLGLQVTAEGVETQVQANILRDYGCDVLQGYLFGKPRPFDDIVELYSERTIPEIEVA